MSPRGSLRVSKTIEKPRSVVAMVSPWGITCGIAKHLSYWVGRLDEKYKPIILAEVPPAYYPQAESYVDSSVGNVEVLRCWSRSDSDSLNSIKQAVQSRGIKIVHLQFDPSFWNGPNMNAFGEWAVGAGVKIITTIHCLLTLTVAHVESLKETLRASNIVAAGTNSLAMAISAFANDKDVKMKSPVKMIPLPYPQPPRYNKPVANGDGPTIFTFGLISNGKGIPSVVEAVDKLRNTHFPNAKYIVRGLAFTGEQKDELARLLDISRTTPWFQIQNLFDSEYAIYKACREASAIVLNHTHKHESSSGTVAIAVASGTPVVVSDSPMFSLYNESGAVYQTDGTPSGLAEGIKSVIHNPEQLDNGCKYILKLTSAESVADMYESAYRKLLGTPEPVATDISVEEPNHSTERLAIDLLSNLESACGHVSRSAQSFGKALAKLKELIHFGDTTES